MSDWWTAVENTVTPATRLRRDEPLAPKTTMRVGGPARYYAEPASVEDLARVRGAAAAAGVPFFILGRGSNLIVMDAGFDGLVVRLSGDFWKQVTVEGEGLVAMCGARLKQICSTAAAAGFAGFEFLEGIPGALGGSLRMNAGAMGGWVFDVVEGVWCLEPDGSSAWHPKSFFHPVYRGCPELVERIALGARMKGAAQQTTPDIRATMEAYAETRKSAQPREPSAGCIFKNPENGYAGKLIDEVGMKGAAEGGAQVSTAHGNFIINADGATADDILKLVRRVRGTVQEQKGVELEPEALLLGARWKDVL